jgi:glycosyltransferase involved in cell wall biosynthesis
LTALGFKFRAKRTIKGWLPAGVRVALRGLWDGLRGVRGAPVVHLPRRTGGDRRIVLDAEPLRHPRAGIGTFTYELTRALLRLDRRSEFFLMNLAPDRGPVAVPRHLDPDCLADWVRSLSPDPRPWRIPPPAVRGADLYFGPCFFGQFHPSFRTVITIHDLCYQRFPEETCPAIYPALVKELPRQAQLADAIVAISQSTRSDVLKFLAVPPEKVRVIPLGIHHRFRPIHDDQVLARARQKYGLPERFVLSIGTIEPRKNLVRLCEAFRQFRRDGGGCALVVVGGKGWKDGTLRRELEQLPRGAVVLTGYVPDEDLPALYNLAELLVYPSLYEGFGLPVVESMACGTPVITSDRSSLPEVAGGAAVLVDPLSPGAIAAAICRVLGDGDLRDRMRRAGLENARRFSWEQTGRQLLALFDELLA